MQNTGLIRRLAAIVYDSLLIGALLFLATTPFIAARGGEPVEIGDNLERDAQLRLELFVRLLEPVMLFLIAGLILFVVAALLLPIFQVSKVASGG